jgi:hypothetical protein
MMILKDSRAKRVPKAPGIADPESYPHIRSQLRPRIYESSSKIRLDSPPIRAHSLHVVRVFGQESWSPGNFGFRGFLISSDARAVFAVRHPKKS